MQGKEKRKDRGHDRRGLTVTIPIPSKNPYLHWGYGFDCRYNNLRPVLAPRWRVYPWVPVPISEHKQVPASVNERKQVPVRINEHKRVEMSASEHGKAQTSAGKHGGERIISQKQPDMRAALEV